CCAPRVDDDPFFSSLLSDTDPTDPTSCGFWSVEAANPAGTRQSYMRNTPVLRTEITDAGGAVAEIIDFAPRFKLYGRFYRPTAFVRLIRPVVGTPRITVRLRPTM